MGPWNTRLTNLVRGSAFGTGVGPKQWIKGIRIGDTVRVKVIKVKGKAIRLLIDAPREVRIVRDEITMKPGGESLQPTPTHSGFCLELSGRQARPTVLDQAAIRDGRVAEAMFRRRRDLSWRSRASRCAELKLEAYVRRWPSQRKPWILRICKRL